MEQRTTSRIPEAAICLTSEARPLVEKLVPKNVPSSFSLLYIEPNTL